ncbi:DUF488 family protein [Agrobacterium salinitolerans]|uniref:DUF488 domain-containing protein n=1 Tax=Agrobacterium salinitolerans TaxID=1183413 RepID=UPI00157278B4|nr:DUF488 domain-containing protein [Agrobacterium salinitolerans]NTA40197.1 DUF488 domain-containing protein [Agrobacterium salinitolerans]
MSERKSSRLPFYTIGHSNRSTEEFVQLLRPPRVECVIDVRKMPMSRSNPQFNSDALAASLQHSQIGSRHIAALGGLRAKQRSEEVELNSFWENKSFHNYADYALSDAFRQGMSVLVEEGKRQVCAIMCSEAVWWRCHRRLIADNLIARDETVFHILGDHRIDPAVLTSSAVIPPDGTIVYPSASMN